MHSLLPLMLAEEAVTHVKQVVEYGSDKLADDMHHRYLYGHHPRIPMNRQRDDAEFEMVKRYGQMGWGRDLQDEARLRWIEMLAEYATRYGQGRCSDQASVAFLYLENVKKKKGLGYFRVSPSDKLITTYDHEFVIMGLYAEPMREIQLSLAQYPTMLSQAVWCDPWAHEWFEIKEGWPRRVRNILRLNGHTEAMKAGITLSCDYYHHGFETSELPPSISVGARIP